MSENAKSRVATIPIWAWLVGCLVLALICAGLIIAGSLAFFFIASSERSSVGETTTMIQPELESTAEELTEIVPDVTRPDESTETQPTLPPTNTPPSPSTASADEPPVSQGNGDPIVDPYADERAQVEANVATIRELTPKTDVVPTQLTQSELRQRLEEDLAEDYSPEEMRQIAIALSAFDFVSPDFDLYNFTLDLLTEQIAGYYDPEEDEFVIISEDDDFDALEKFTHAHEYVHALQDQYYNLERLEDDSLDSEAIFALQALAEGDAMLVGTMYMLEGYFSQEELFDILNQSLTIDTSVLDSAPPVLARELEFPYLAGLEFVQSLHDQGGFEAVDQAWQNPPLSSEHILHPERYSAGDAPQVVALAPLTDTLGTGWVLADEDTFGEFYLREYLVQQLNDNSVDLASSGWGGDRYAVYWNEANQELVLALRLAWDTPTDAEEFIQAYVDFADSRFGFEGDPDGEGGICWNGDDVICLKNVNGDTLVVRAPDMVTAEAVAAAQNN